jgi:hypothetical protein
MDCHSGVNHPSGYPRIRWLREKKALEAGVAKNSNFDDPNETTRRSIDCYGISTRQTDKWKQ